MQDSIANKAEKLKDKSSKVIVERGQIVKQCEDYNGTAYRERSTQHWTDRIDNESFDFDLGVI